MTRAFYKAVFSIEVLSEEPIDAWLWAPNGGE